MLQNPISTDNRRTRDVECLANVLNGFAGGQLSTDEESINQIFVLAGSEKVRKKTVKIFRCF
ncbi:MAG: hypothetical protein K9M51_00715 [Candidatus Gracilibacteria bacterium]|nr:hypothetical protein [Candidatus Gracilibacteria bacterium]